VEIYIVSVLLLILVLAMTATQFFAARVYTLAATKLTSTASGRKIMNDIRDQVRGADDVDVVITIPSATHLQIFPSARLKLATRWSFTPTTRTTKTRIMASSIS